MERTRDQDPARARNLGWSWLTRSQPDMRLERVMGIEPTLVAWEATVLPLNYTRWPTQILCRFQRVGKFRVPTDRSRNGRAFFEWHWPQPSDLTNGRNPLADPACTTCRGAGDAERTYSIT